MTNPTSSGEIVVGLDIGTTKVCAVVGEVDDGGISIMGAHSVPCRGLRKGIVSNIDWTVRAIKDAVDAAQNMAGVEIRTVYAGVAQNGPPSGSNLAKRSENTLRRPAHGPLNAARPLHRLPTSDWPRRPIH